MQLNQQVKNSIAERSGVLITRASLASLGGASQMTLVLKRLVDVGELIRISSGIYTKATLNPFGKPIPTFSTDVIVKEVLKQLGISSKEAWTETDGPDWSVIVCGTRPRVNRTLQVGDSRVKIFSLKSADRLSVPKNSAELPRSNVREYVEWLARANHVTGEHTSLDTWAEAVTSAAGDSVQLDRVGRLLSRLKQKRVISGTQMAHLMTSYLSEK